MRRDFCTGPAAHGTSPPPPKPETGSGAANSLIIIINFMHILCKPLVHRQDGIDLIRISIIEPFGRQLLIRESVKHRRGWRSEGLSGDGQTLSSEQSELQPPACCPFPGAAGSGPVPRQDPALSISSENDKDPMPRRPSAAYEVSVPQFPQLKMGDASFTRQANRPGIAMRRHDAEPITNSSISQLQCHRKAAAPG